MKSYSKWSYFNSIKYIYHSSTNILALISYLLIMINQQRNNYWNGCIFPRTEFDAESESDLEILYLYLDKKLWP